MTDQLLNMVIAFFVSALVTLPITLAALHFSPGRRWMRADTRRLHEENQAWLKEWRAKRKEAARLDGWGSND